MASSLVKGFWRAAAVGALAIGAVACGGDAGTDASDASGGAGAAAGAAGVTIEQFQFRPGEIAVEPGTTVTWTNQDTVAHTVKDNGELFPESDELAKGESFSFTYDDPGTYPYICGIHPYMKGTVTVS